jgi:integrase
MEEKGFDLYTSLPILSTYLGHKSIVETEYYLRLVKENDESILKSRDYVKEIYGKKEIFYE